MKCSLVTGWSLEGGKFLTCCYTANIMWLTLGEVNHVTAKKGKCDAC